jgi:chromosome segregation ATPase
MGRPLPTSAWDILPFLQDENIYDCEENNLEILKQAIIDEITGLRSDVVRLHQINEDHCRAVNTLSVEAVELTRERDRLRDALELAARDLARGTTTIGTYPAVLAALRSALRKGDTP